MVIYASSSTGLYIPEDCASLSPTTQTGSIDLAGTAHGIIPHRYLCVSAGFCQIFFHHHRAFSPEPPTGWSLKSTLVPQRNHFGKVFLFVFNYRESTLNCLAYLHTHVCSGISRTRAAAAWRAITTTCRCSIVSRALWGFSIHWFSHSRYNCM